MPFKILILGAGITGLTSAISLSKHLPEPKPDITVIEIRPTLSTIGGAVNLTPKALRYLDHLGVLEILNSQGAGADVRTIEIFDLYTGKKAGELDFTGPNGDGVGSAEKNYLAKRVMRHQLQEALLQVAKSQENTTILFGKKAIQIAESTESVQVMFEDGSLHSADILLGCDGIHSSVRSLLIDPNRQPTYTGVAVSMATVPIQSPEHLRWRTTGLVMSRRGSFLSTYFSPQRTSQYLAAVIETPTPEVPDREGWKVKGADQEAIKSDILSRFTHPSIPELKPLIASADTWSVYPIYALPPSGPWISPAGRAVLIGDSAHAMPPQGDSTTLCIESAILLTRTLLHHQTHSLPAILKTYERIRRPKTYAAYQSAVMRWENVKDCGWVRHKVLMRLTEWWIWWTKGEREREEGEDLWGVDVQVYDEEGEEEGEDGYVRSVFEAFDTS